VRSDMRNRLITFLVYRGEQRAQSGKAKSGRASTAFPEVPASNFPLTIVSTTWPNEHPILARFPKIRQKCSLTARSILAKVALHLESSCRRCDLVYLPAAPRSRGFQHSLGIPGIVRRQSA
jgi:hypothetical protein